MRTRILVLALFLALAGHFARGQTTQTLSAANQCTAPIDVTGLASLGMQMTGTWSATLQPEVAIGGQPAVNATVTPSTSSAAQATITANGVYLASVSGYTSFIVCVTAYVSGTATIHFQGNKNLNAGLFGGSGASMGPVLNAQAYGASSSLADNNAAFTAVVGAANAAAYHVLGTPTIRNQFTLACPSSAQSSQTVSVTITAGDTALVFVNYPAPPPAIVSITAGSNSFLQQAPIQNVFDSANTVVYTTPAGGAMAFSGNLTITDSTASPFCAYVLDVSNVGTLTQTQIVQTCSANPCSSNNTTTTPTASPGIEDANDLIVSSVSAYTGGTFNISANTGSLVTSQNGTISTPAQALVTNTSAAPGALTTSVTCSVSCYWGLTSIELRGVAITVPTVYFPAAANGTDCYNFSGGLTFPYPVTLRGEPGACLYPTGTGDATNHAGLVFGTSGNGGYSVVNGYTLIPWTVQDLTFRGGQNLTYGIYIYPFDLTVHVLHNWWINFGGGATFNSGIYLAGHQNDAFFSNNYLYAYDGNPHVWVNTATTGNDLNARFLGNYAVCTQGKFGLGTAATNCGALIAYGGSALMMDGNYFSYFCPNVSLVNPTGNGAGDKIENNNFEESGVSGCPVISFQSGIDGLSVLGNYVQSNGGNYFIAPFGAGHTLVNARVGNNNIYSLPIAQPVVQLNNVVGQFGNLAFQNMCSTSFATGSSPCPVTHTAGASISQWNSDYAPALTFAAGTTASYTFLTTYSIAPKCVIPPNIPGAATTLTISTLNTTTLTITASASNSSTVYAACNPDAQ